MRLYTFINMYLSPIQQGIQTAHLVHELFNKYLPSKTYQRQNLIDWSEHHKTIIVLNGGTAFDIDSLYHFFLRDDNPNFYPYVKFNESEEALWGITTGIGIVLPPAIYEIATAIRNKEFLNLDDAVNAYALSDFQPNSWEREMIITLNDYSLAR